MFAKSFHNFLPVTSLSEIRVMYNYIVMCNKKAGACNTMAVSSGLYIIFYFSTTRFFPVRFAS